MSLLEIAGLALIVLVVAVLILLFVIGKRRDRVDFSPLQARLDSIERGQERGERELRDEFARNRDESANHLSVLRQEVGTSLKGVSDSVLRQIAELTQVQKGQMEGFDARLGKLTETNEKKGDALREAVEKKLTQIQNNNDAKLEEMRKTVDEKLQTTLEKRLGDSFKLVSDRLEMVHKGLGEMQTLASGVGDLKKVLTNVKTRGTWGEIQLGNLLEQILTPDQYEKNVRTKSGSNDQVEFAIKLPGRGEAGDRPVWLPIDAKFPKEDYERLIDASERADAAGVEEFSKQLEVRIKMEARMIREKYLDPPQTTDFGLLFLPTEGLYAEVLRRPGLTDILQREFRVVIAGPTTLLALLNSLQMGFQTLAIEKRSAEIRNLLGAVKTEFGKFGEVIEKVHKKIMDAGDVIDKAKTRSRVIERKLRSVEGLPAAEARNLLASAELEADDGESEPAGGEEPTT
ncbi:MAG: DNA recombination protein RmuC [Candidatus Aminicenantes bacterium]|nr:DNA recombination protein RmuC [Candidatus Aminicenantes bacterium]